MSDNSFKLTVFLDAIGRTLIGKIKNDEGDDKIALIQNPALMQIQANPQNNELRLQILPVLFKEFLSDKTQHTVWRYNKSSITVIQDIEYSGQLIAQYEQMFPVPNAQPKVVKLFDDE